MDIEQVKRVNTLSKELLRHGFAETMDEAVKMANSIEGRKGEGLEITEKGEPTEETSYGFEIKKIRTAINELKETIAEQKENIHQLHCKVAELVSELEKVKTRQTAAKEESKENKQTTLPKEEKKVHPRSGNYKPDDVAVDKFFYYGQK